MPNGLAIAFNINKLLASSVFLYLYGTVQAHPASPIHCPMPTITLPSIHHAMVRGRSLPCKRGCSAVCAIAKVLRLYRRHIFPTLQERTRNRSAQICISGWTPAKYVSCKKAPRQSTHVSLLPLSGLRPQGIKDRECVLSHWPVVVIFSFLKRASTDASIS